MSSSGDEFGHLLNDDDDELFFLGHEPAAVRGGPGPASQRFQDDEMAFMAHESNPHEAEEFDTFVKNAEKNTTFAKNRDLKKQAALRKSLEKKRVKTAAAQDAQAAKDAQAARRDQAIRDQATRDQAVRDQAAHAAHAAAALSESRRQVEFQQFKLEADRVPNCENTRNYYSYYNQSPENQLIINRFIANGLPYSVPPFGGSDVRAAEAAARWQGSRRGGYKSKKYRYNNKSKKSKTNKRRRYRSRKRN